MSSTKGKRMCLVTMQARVRLNLGDHVLYNPPHDCEDCGKTGVVSGFATDEKDPENPFWVQIAFDGDEGTKKFVALRHTLLQEQRMTVTK